MKIVSLFVVFGFLVISVSCNSNQKLLKEQGQRIMELESLLETANSVNDFSDVKSFICTNSLSGINANSGEFIPKDSAKKKIELRKDYLRRITNGQYDPKNDIRGFVIGLEKLRELIKRIDKENRGILIPEEKIIGVRAYYAATDTVINNQRDTIPDVLLVPIAQMMGTTSYPNYYDVDNDFNKKFLITSDLILNKSVPCPTACP